MRRITNLCSECLVRIAVLRAVSVMYSVPWDVAMCRAIGRQKRFNTACPQHYTATHVRRQ
jgi:hypothetical protein